MSTALHDVAIIGLGPAGAMLANLLGQAGLSVLVLDREAGIYPLPRAIHFDGEVMRAFQGIGLRPQVEAISRPGLNGMRFVNADGETLMIRGGTQLNGPHGCASNYYFNQPELEQVLREGLRRFERVRVLLRHEVLAVQDEGEQVRLTVRSPDQVEPLNLHARYVVGCDGARSMLRCAMGSPMHDLGLRQPWLVFDVLLRDYAPELPDHTVQYCDPARPMTWCNVTGRRRRWEIMVLPGDDPVELVKPESLWRLVSRWMSPEHAEIERAVVYTFQSVIAQGWRQGRLLLAGDAAHQTPPFLGQGMCAAIRDVANLAWKLQAVLARQAPDTLLDSYEAERSPHVHAFIELAVRLGNIIQTTDPEQARVRDARFRQDQPEIFEFPAPRIGPGLWQGEGAPVAQIFPQPRLDDGRLLDEALGQGFSVIGLAPALAAASAVTRAHWQASGAAVLEACGSLQDWLQAQAAQAVVLRPDRYIMGLAKSPGELDAITALMPVAPLQPH